MKVILIKIYAEEEEMVSLVSGTPLGPGDMTVISQISDCWRDGPVRPHRLHTKSCRRLAQARVNPLLRAIYTSLSPPAELPPDTPIVRWRKAR